jgi:hypothetical protein
VSGIALSYRVVAPDLGCFGDCGRPAGTGIA